MRRMYGGVCRDPKYSTDNAGNQQIIEERNRSLEQAVLSNRGLCEGSVLEIGCGEGGCLPFLCDMGIKDSQLIGIDLVSDRLHRAHRYYSGMSFLNADAAALPFSDKTFSIILIIVMFSTILDSAVRANIAREALRVLRNDGLLIVYDFRYNNPVNPDVRGVRESDIRRLFEGCLIRFQHITLLPPLARRLGRYTKTLYPLLSRFSFLRTHYLCTIQRT